MSSPASKDKIDPSESSSEDRLLALFSNRIALKKAYRDLRTENRWLEEQLQAAKKETDALLTKIEFLESRLADSEHAPPLLLHYRLRGLRERLVERVVDMMDQHSAAIAGQRKAAAERDWRRSLDAQLDKVSCRIADEKEQRDGSRRAVSEKRDVLDRYRAIWWYWRRKRMRAEYDAMRRELAAREDALDALLAHYHSLQHQQAPQPDTSLGTADKRQVNLLALALIRRFLGCFAEDDLVAKIRSACDREPGAIDYGSADAVARLTQLVDRRESEWDTLCVSRTMANELMSDMRSLLKLAQYDHANATLPAEFLVHGDMMSAAGSGISIPPSQLLREDPLRLRSLLLR